MSAYKNALHLSSAEQGQRLQLAAELVAEGRAVVVLDGIIALCPGSDNILCEVISSGNIAPQAQAESAKRLLRASTLGGLVDTRGDASGLWWRTMEWELWSCGVKANFTWSPAEQSSIKRASLSSASERSCEDCPVWGAVANKCVEPTAKIVHCGALPWRGNPVRITGVVGPLSDNRKLSSHGVVCQSIRRALLQRC